MAERKISNLSAGVRFPYPAPNKNPPHFEAGGFAPNMSMRLFLFPIVGMLWKYDEIKQEGYSPQNRH